jgi:hypothetical protein
MMGGADPLMEVGVAEFCYEAIAKRLKGSFRSSGNHIVIQQCLLASSQ